MFLRLLNDRPSDPGGNQARSDAIKLYYERGMRNCVSVEPQYGILLERIALRIRELRDLPEGARPSFATAEDAFSYDWSTHFAPAGPPSPATPQPTSPQITPKPLSSAVAFYITRRAYQSDPTQVPFADQLIEEVHQATDRTFAALMTDMRGAAVLENVHVFHAAPKPAIPPDVTSLLARLKALADAKVLTLLIVDSDVWPGSNDAQSRAIGTIAQSLDWSGPILVAPVGQASVDNLPARFTALPAQSDVRVSAIRRALVDVRGRTLSSSAETVRGADSVPLLNGVGPTRSRS
jgi:hypothetical protein